MNEREPKNVDVEKTAEKFVATGEIPSSAIMEPGMWDAILDKMPEKAQEAIADLQKRLEENEEGLVLYTHSGADYCYIGTEEQGTSMTTVVLKGDESPRPEFYTELFNYLDLEPLSWMKEE
jgi:hypothetical protein